VKFGTYFPYPGKLCRNGREYVKRQLARAGIAFEALDNGLLTGADARRAQALCDGLSAARIEALARKWLARLPHPFTAADRQAGYRYHVSILQAECALTQVLDHPVAGRVFFEEVIRENLDIGRPDQVQLIFGRRVTRRTPGRFRTRVMTEGSPPSLHVDYKRSRIKQHLLRHPGQEIHCRDLVARYATPAAAPGGAPLTADDLALARQGAVATSLGGAGVVLDGKAKSQYRRRVAELREELDEAEKFNDPGRAARARDEIEIITDQLKSAVGLGGRDRKVASHAERARVMVTQAIKSALKKIAGCHPALGEHLATFIKTGYHCVYAVDSAQGISWRI
jgi:hypothetical protein